ncbi:hypothetical protein CLOM_g20159 [Closterium sp. NIES-68]|nr:hypothetical protein CLOM_g20159 [Closterium sp. NIES-68]GJP57516.1 hypothetical protein CLOP_g12226 [Closterium sp. NIES-67]
MAIWVFGYGSLVWRPGFASSARVPGHIRGYRRVFYQGNTDHRGTPEKPGRTVTLVEEKDAVTYGVAYRLAGDEHEQNGTLQYLLHREKEYDQQDPSDSHPPVIRVLVFIASDNPVSNPYYLGPAPLEAMAWQIATASGPSGPNSEYLLNLQRALSDLGACDPHVDALAALVSTMLLHVTTAVANAASTTTAIAAAACTAASTTGNGANSSSTTCPKVHEHAHSWQRECTGTAGCEACTCTKAQGQAALGLIVDAAVARMAGCEVLAAHISQNSQPLSSP